MSLPSYAQSFIIAVEGGFSDHARDRGGATKYGISTGFLKGKYPRESDAEIKKRVSRMTVEEAADIYFYDFWQPGYCHHTTSEALSLVHFDSCVQHGHGTAASLLQQVLGLEDDGIIGPKTRAAMAEAPWEKAQELIDNRKEYYKRLKDFDVFGRGWLNRLYKLRKAILELR